MSVKCASHQVNLSVRTAVVGIPAICAVGNSVVAERSDALEYRKQHADTVGSPHRLVCGAVVRLAKYLVNMYYEEFLLSLTTHVARLTFGRPAPESVASATMWAGMAGL